MDEKKKVAIDADLYKRLVELGIIDESQTRANNVGESNYAKHLIQPWSIWADWDLNPWDADIVKRILRSKGGTPEAIRANRILDYNKIIHICNERKRQLEVQSQSH